MSDVDEFVVRQPARVGKDRRKLPSWRLEELRTTFWVVPSILVVVSVLIAIVAGTAALWAGLRVRSLGATLVASLIMGVAVSGMHYTGMAAMRVYPGKMPAMSGDTAASFLLPLLLGISLVTFILTLMITLSPTEEEIHEDRRLRHRLDANVRG